MYAIRNKRTGKWLYGSDKRYSPPHQRTSDEQALTFFDRQYAEAEFRVRKCNSNYEVVEVELKVKGGTSQ